MASSFGVEFNMQINALAGNYCSKPITFGDLSDGSKWVWAVYVFGQNSDNLNGSLQVFGTASGQRCVALSPRSKVLNLNQKYHVKWIYNKAKGGKLYIDDQDYGSIDHKGELDVKLSKNICLKKNLYNGGGRGHTNFVGSITEVCVSWIGDYYAKNVDITSNEDKIKLIKPGSDDAETKEQFGDGPSDDNNFIQNLFEKLKIPNGANYVEIFTNEEIDQQSLYLLKEQHLIDLGVKLGPRLILLNHIKQNECL